MSSREAFLKGLRSRRSRVRTVEEQQRYQERKRYLWVSLLSISFLYSMLSRP